MLPLRRLLHLIRKNKLDAEIEAELRSHLEMRTADNLASGMAPEEARHDASVRFGNVLAIREATAAVKVTQAIEDLWRDVVYAMRQLRHSPGFAVTAA